MGCLSPGNVPVGGSGLDGGGGGSGEGEASGEVPTFLSLAGILSSGSMKLNSFFGGHQVRPVWPKKDQRAQQCTLHFAPLSLKHFDVFYKNLIPDAKGGFISPLHFSFADGLRFFQPVTACIVPRAAPPFPPYIPPSQWSPKAQ